MFWQVSGILLGFLSIFVYAQVLIDVVEKEELNMKKYLACILLGVYAFSTFTTHDVDVVAYMYIGLYIMMILGTLSSRYWDSKQE